MRSLIVYASKYGGVAQCALDLKQHLEIPSDVLPVNDPSINLDEYDIIIAGGSIHSGSLQKDLKKFLKKNRDELLKKKFAYFICCLMPGDKADSHIIPKHFPEKLREHAFANAFPGAIVDYVKMNWLEKIILKKITGTKESFSRKDDSAIKDFADKINRM